MLFITADGARGAAGATLWLDRTIATNNVVLPGEEASPFLEVFDPSFIDIQDWVRVATDADATRMALYILPSSDRVLTALAQYRPPSDLTGGAVPALITSNALASVIVTRTRSVTMSCNDDWESIVVPDADDIVIPDALRPSAASQVGGASGAGSAREGALPLALALLGGVVATAAGSWGRA